MKFSDIDFSPCWQASGATGFFGEGYWYHRALSNLGLDFNRSTFVSKTTTLNSRVGNMEVDRFGRPVNKFPKCVIVKPFKKVVLNSVGLSGPGAAELFVSRRWESIQKPFMLSFMSVEKERSERIKELQIYLGMLFVFSRSFNAPFALQVNFSCPNVGLDTSKLFEEIREVSEITRSFGIPLVAKINVLIPPYEIFKLKDHVSAFCVSNTIPWGKIPKRIDWEGLFGSKTSPLAHLGGGGLSGYPLLELVRDWIVQARATGYKGYINACGGILKPSDVDVMKEAGANSVSIGSIAILRGWRVKKTIQRTNKIFR